MKSFTTVLFVLLLQVQQAVALFPFLDTLFCDLFGFAGNLARGPLNDFINPLLAGQQQMVDFEPYDMIQFTGASLEEFQGCAVTIKVEGEITGDAVNEINGIAIDIMPPSVAISATATGTFNAPSILLFQVCVDAIGLNVEVTLPDLGVFTGIDLTAITTGLTDAVNTLFSSLVPSSICVPLF